MKYIDAERLRKEVKRLEKAAHKSALGCADSETRKFHEGKDYAYQHVGILIGSLQQEQQKETGKSLEEAADHHIRKVVDAVGHPGWDWETQDIIDAFIAGAEWQKEKMLKDVVEGEGHPDDCEIWVNLVGYGYKFNDGDKIRIVILKEEE